MFKSITLENVQTIKYVHLDLHPGVNVIYGETDQGKSAIIRGVHEVVTNSMTADDIINWNLPKSKATARITINTENHTIVRQLGKAGNMYILDGHEYKAPKQGIPDEVRECLNMDIINIQTQLEPPFLLKDISSGQVAKRLNAVVGLSKTDDTLYNINAEVRELKRQESQQKKLLSDFEKNLNSLHWIDDYEKELSLLSKFYNRYKETKSRVVAAKKALFTLQELYERQSELSKFGELRKDVDTLSQLVEKRDSVKETLKKATKSKRQLNELKEQLAYKNKYIKLKKQVDKIYQTIDAYHTVKKQLTTATEELEYLKEMYNKSDSIHKRKKKHETELERKKESIGNICPICGSNM